MAILSYSFDLVFHYRCRSHSTFFKPITLKFQAHDSKVLCIWNLPKDKLSPSHDCSMYCVENIAMARAKNLKIEQQAEAMASHCLTKPMCLGQRSLSSNGMGDQSQAGPKTQTTVRKQYIFIYPCIKKIPSLKLKNLRFCLVYVKDRVYSVRYLLRCTGPFILCKAPAQAVIKI